MGYKKKIGLIFLLALLFFPNIVFSAKTLIFVVDVSGSMRKDNLYSKVTDTLCAFIQREFETGDNLILCSFGNTFYINREVPNASREQMQTFLPNIEKLPFNDQWTYMTLAFGEVAKLADRYRQKYPKNPIYIYIYTDGTNEPPPYIKNPISFDQIIKWYFKSYLPKGTFLFIVTLGVEPDPKIPTLLDTLGKGGKDKNEFGVKKSPPGTAVSPPPTGNQPDTSKITTIKEETVKKEGPKPPPPPWVWILIISLIAIAIIVGLWLSSIPKFPVGAYLVYLDESGNVMTRFNLRSRQKFGSNKLRVSDDLNVSGIMPGSFKLIAKKGDAVSLRVIARDKSAKFLNTGAEIKTGEEQLLYPDDEFEFSGARFKYEKGG